MSLTKVPPYVTTGELGDILGVQAWRIVRLFELGAQSEPQRIGGRRLIPRSMIPEIVDALRNRGWLAESAEVSPRPPDPAPRQLGSIHRDEVLPLREAARRMGWADKLRDKRQGGTTP